MNKALILLFALIAGTAAMTYLYFSKLRSETTGNDLALNAVVKNAAFVAEFSGDAKFFSIMKEQDILNDLIGDDATALSGLREHFLAQQKIRELLKGQKIYCGLVTEGINSKLLFAAQLSSNQYDLLSSFLKQHDNISSAGKQVFAFKISDTTSAYIGLTEKLILLSPSEKIVRDHLDTIETESDFKAYIKRSENKSKSKLLSIFFNFKELPGPLKSVIRGKIDGEIGFLKNPAGFGELSYNFSKTQLLFYGSSITKFSGSYYDLFSELEPQQITINNILPANTANYKILTISNYSKWVAGLDGYFRTIKRGEKINAKLKSVRENYFIDARHTLAKYFGGQVISFQLESGETMGAIALTDGNKVRQLFTDLGNVYNEDISVFKDKSLLYTLFGDVFGGFNQPYYMFKDNYLIFANKANILTNFVEAYNSGELLVNNQNYMNFRNQFPGLATISLYVNLKNSRDIFRRDLHSEDYARFRPGGKLSKYTTFCYQMSGDKGKFQTNLILSQPANELPDTTAVN